LIIVQALLFLPCLPFTLGAGFLYGCVAGSIVVHIASTIAAFLGFVTSRYVARNFLERKLMSKSGDSTWKKIDNAIKQDGFKLVFLIRFSPLHPYGLCNYLFGLTSVSLKDYMLGSFLGMMPTTVVEVYFGTAIKSFADIFGEAPETAEFADDDAPAPTNWFFWFGLLATLAVTVYMTWWLKRKLNTHLEGYQEVAGAQSGDVELLELGEQRSDVCDETDDGMGMGMGMGDDDDDDDSESDSSSDQNSHRGLQPVAAACCSEDDDEEAPGSKAQGNGKTKRGQAVQSPTVAAAGASPLKPLPEKNLASGAGAGMEGYRLSAPVEAGAEAAAGPAPVLVIAGSPDPNAQSHGQSQGQVADKTTPVLAPSASFARSGSGAGARAPFVSAFSPTLLAAALDEAGDVLEDGQGERARAESIACVKEEEAQVGL
jgi:uncharacterized membrane protein YdjX (TVP38/TMEM64 family)